MRTGVLVVACALLALPAFAQSVSAALQSTVVTPAIDCLPIQVGLASWYGELHRGKLMANGRRFDPDQLTAASWFYPLGTRVCVTLKTDPRVLNPQPSRTVWVTITDRGPHRRLVRNGRIIDLSHGVFRRLADPDVGLVEVIVHPETPPQQWVLRSPG